MHRQKPGVASRTLRTCHARDEHILKRCRYATNTVWLDPRLANCRRKSSRIGIRRVRFQPHMRPFAKELDVDDARQVFQDRHQTVAILGDHFHHLARKARSQVSRAVNSKQLSVMKQRDARAPLRFVEVWRRHENRDSLAEKLGEQLPELAP
jgi:hypothetical protein